jgi:hypothetical protein
VHHAPFYKKRGYCLKGARCDFLHNVKPQQYDQLVIVNAYDYSRPFSFEKLPGEQALHPLNVMQHCLQINSPSTNHNQFPSPGHAYHFPPFQQSAHPF